MIEYLNNVNYLAFRLHGAVILIDWGHIVISNTENPANVIHNDVNMSDSKPLNCHKACAVYNCRLSATHHMCQKLVADGNHSSGFGSRILHSLGLCAMRLSDWFFGFH